MSFVSNDLRAQLAALTDWWDGAGVAVDTRQLERMLAGILEKSEASSQAPLPAIIRNKPAGNEISGRLASGCRTLDDLKKAIETFNGCDLKRSAGKTVFSAGPETSAIMVIGEAPGREEDETGLPFTGPAGQLLDKMLSSIGLSRQTNAYMTNMVFWRPPGNRNPTDEELAICRPFVDRHIQLVAPKLIIATGAVPSQSLLGTADPIGKLRGQKNLLTLPAMAEGIPVFSIYHPSYLLKRPAAKKQAWHDLLVISREMQKLNIGPPTQS